MIFYDYDEKGFLQQKILKQNECFRGNPRDLTPQVLSLLFKSFFSRVLEK